MYANSGGRKGHSDAVLQVERCTNNHTLCETRENIAGTVLTGTFHQIIFTKQEENRKYNLDVHRRILAVTPGNSPIVVAFSRTRGPLSRPVYLEYLHWQPSAL